MVEAVPSLFTCTTIRRRALALQAAALERPRAREDLGLERMPERLRHLARHPQTRLHL